MSQSIFKRRVYITGLLIMGIACFFIYRLAVLHFSDKIKISNTEDVEVRRGYIKDSDGYILAVSIERDSLFANPEEIEDPLKTAKLLSPIIGTSEALILDRLQRKKRFIWLKRKINDHVVQRIKELKIKGLHFRKEYQRIYPHGKLASNILGFVDVDNKGLDGIEYRFDKLLSGREKGGIFDTDKELITGNSISLTIDRFIQYFSEKEIEKAVVKFRAKRGIAMVLEVKTGKLLAVANYPDFDPNYYWRYSDEERRNSAIVYSFEPGSTLKMIAVAHILESVPNILKRKLFCNGKIKIADTSLKCTGRHGSVDLYDIIKYSCNVGIIQAMNEVRKDKFYKTLREFGFGEKVGIQFPGESRGILRPLIEWSGLSKYSISIGQEISVSPLQLIAAIGAIANQGVYIIPSIVESIYREDGSIVQSFYLKTRGQIIRGDTARTIIRLMRGVVIGGTGKHASLEYYNAVGKTGTAQKSKGRGGYYQDKVNVSFIGIAPYENPDICVLVMIDEPQLGNSGGEIAAPVFASIAHRVLLYRRVKLKRIIAKDPIVREYRTRKFNGTTMPNFKGLLMSESIQMLVAIQKTANIKYSFIGTGKVYKQLPIYGKAISKGQQIILYLR